MKRLKNILLVYPEIPTNTYWSFTYALRYVNKKSSMPPLGLITVAALLPDTCNLKLVDMNIEPLTEADVLWADAVFVSAMIIQQESLRQAIALCNRLNKPVVAGGPYPTSSHEEIAGVDHFVLGEAEAVLAEFIADYEAGTARPMYHGDTRPDITYSVTPRFDLLKREAYASMAVQYSRGCPFKCEFCDIWVVYGNKPRLKSAENVLAELDTLYRLGWKDAVFMVDDNFIGNKSRVKKELLPALIKWQKAHNYVFEFYTEASINMADDAELMRLMSDAGFNQVFVGIETPSKEALEETGKSQNLKYDLKDAVRAIQQHGMEVMAGFIIGFDSDTEDIFERQIAFIQETGIPKAMVGLLHALPGTVLYNRLEKEGRLSGHALGSNTHTMATNVVTKMDSETLKQGYKRVLGTLYDANMKNYFARCDMLLDNLKGTGFKQREVRFDEIKSLLKSLTSQPFTGYGWQYLKYITRNLFRHPDLFAEVITYAIIGHHFRTITQETLKADQVISRLDEIYAKTRAQLTQYSQAMKSSSANRLADVSRIWGECKKSLGRTKGRISHIHRDFRGDVTSRYEETQQKIRQLFAEEKQDTGFDRHKGAKAA
ncbi:B12-binding domain-containing radical SAM protein [Desulfosudis oleivorans]|uniref:Radical SAM domain protein n=1 Tax=Desulfosudis oleivorans (strain DSM 6200 / JCM 39069 / Hxd3) TaxID=96561 RepID=A8ZWI8_DESOH|nr:B12-binding domain-containing radical SAM protein [Desulfosudis oleivorans]ABW66796.1 Radical SAM domain protein [Desulfosudis oleivorans Hxd3]